MIRESIFVITGHSTATKAKRRFFPSLNLAQPGLCANFGVKRIGIFGSFARGEEKRTSDVDVLVEFAPGPGNL